MAGTGGSLGAGASQGVRSNLGSQDSLTVTDAATTNLTVPAGTNIAEITVLDNDKTVIFRTDGVAPTNSPILGMVGAGYIELESFDEATNFQAIANTGQTVRLYVEYKSDLLGINT